MTKVNVDVSNASKERFESVFSRLKTLRAKMLERSSKNSEKVQSPLISDIEIKAENFFIQASAKVNDKKECADVKDLEFMHGIDQDKDTVQEGHDGATIPYKGKSAYVTLILKIPTTRDLLQKRKKLQRTKKRTTKEVIILSAFISQIDAKSKIAFEELSDNDKKRRLKREAVLNE